MRRVGDDGAIARYRINGQDGALAERAADLADVNGAIRRHAKVARKRPPILGPVPTVLP